MDVKEIRHMYKNQGGRAGGSGRTSRRRNEHEQADSGEAGSRTQSSEKIKKQLSEWLRRPENADRGDFDTAVGYLAWRIKHPIHLQDASGAIRAFPGLPGQSRGWGKAISIPAPAPGRGDHAERSPWSSLEPIVHAVPEGQGLSPHEVSAYAQYFWKRGEAVRALTALMNSSGSRQAHHRSDWSAFVTGPSGERRPEEALLRRVNTVADYIGKIRQEEQRAARAPSSIAPMSESPTTSPMMPDTQPMAVDMVDTGADDQAQMMPSPDSAYPSVALADTGTQADEPGQSADILETAMQVLNDPEPQTDEPGQVEDVLAQAMAVLNEDGAAEDVVDDASYEAALAVQRELEDRYLARFVEWLATQELEIQETSGRGNNCSLYALNMGARATQRRLIEETTLDEAVQEQRQTFVDEPGHGGMLTAMLALDADRGGHGRSLIRNLNEAYGIAGGDEGFVVAMYRPITAISMDDANGAFVPSYMDEHGVVNECPADPTRLIRVMQTDHHYAVILPREAAHAAPPVSKKRSRRTKNQKKEQASANADWPAPCDLCGRQFKTPDGWKNHMFKEHKIPNICEFCGNGYATASTLKRHQQHSHVGEQSHPHKAHGKGTPDSNFIGKHAPISVEKRTFVCDVCHKTYSSRRALKMHQLTHDKGRTYSCTSCDEVFGNSITLARHKKAHLREESLGIDSQDGPPDGLNSFNEENLSDARKVTYTCQDCGAKYTHPGSLARHKKMHTEGKAFACDTCGKLFGASSDLKEHKKSHSDVKPYMCQICDAKFKHKKSLAMHNQDHVDEKSFVCGVCDKWFRSSRDLKNHEIRHIIERPYACTACDSRFPSAASLSRHKQEHAEKKSFVCDVCAKWFKTSTRLKEHKRTHTGESPYACSHCDKRFKSWGNLDRHNRIHTGEKPYICSICNAPFRSADNLKSHARTHAGEKPFACDVCGRKFSSQSNMSRHHAKHTR
ncbi:C2H2-type zinc finger protein (plasmid) [Burkholderia sp. MS455]|uniref:C2H2-type zinc finger protein n=1 Tax=Burkholderia sp. MS455 TaxID=2811788 RepID=UPI00195C3821|nr:C2H2-type zinc finger protein [Burkholderia sp. MS455]QRR11751.1 C2H2-type zinc finger protein [Burkholderia sp. MS455]